jgi:hypothetical protein
LTGICIPKKMDDSNSWYNNLPRRSNKIAHFEHISSRTLIKSFKYRVKGCRKSNDRDVVKKYSIFLKIPAERLDSVRVPSRTADISQSPQGHIILARQRGGHKG